MRGIVLLALLKPTYKFILITASANYVYVASYMAIVLPDSEM